MPTNTNDLKIDNRSILEKRRIDALKTRKKLKLLAAIGGLLLLLFLIIVYAAIKEGGLSNLTKGDKNVVQNTLKNIGTTFTNDDTEPTEVEKDFNKPFALPTQAPRPKDVTKSKEQNFIAFDAGLSSYFITIKKGTYVSLTNNTDSPISLKFSDGKIISLRDQESENVTFNKTGEYTFVDTLDNTSSQISGSIKVED